MLPSEQPARQTACPLRLWESTDPEQAQASWQKVEKIDLYAMPDRFVCNRSNGVVSRSAVWK